MPSNYGFRLIFVVVTILVMTGAGLFLKGFLVPDSFGRYGSYRADTIPEEASLPIKHATNSSCFSCHPYEAKIHKAGRHSTISCEFCHSTYADHIRDNKKFAALPVKKEGDITVLCLRCHNTEIKARSQEVIKTVAMPAHLADQNVKLTHNCNQCHHVHAPLKYIDRARKITGIMEKTL